ncbi:hypothetical protein KAU32_10905 [bacterium]|nr:hypothetical protein [bacterium]
MKRRKKLWEKLYSAIWANDKEGFLDVVKLIEERYYSQNELEDLLFKAGITLSEEFEDGQLAKEYYEKYLKRFKENGRFSEQVLKRIDAV